MADAPPPAAPPEEGEARDSRADDYARGRMASDGRDPYRDDDRLRRDPRYEDRRPDDRHRRPDDRYDDRRRYDDRYDRRDDRRYDRRCETGASNCTRNCAPCQIPTRPPHTLTNPPSRRYDDRYGDRYDDRRRDYDRGGRGDRYAPRDDRRGGGDGDARREAEERMARDGLLCDPGRGGRDRRSRSRSPRRRRERSNKWDDMGAMGGEVQAAAQQAAALTGGALNAQQQQQLMATLLAQGGGQPGAAGGAMNVAGRKQRELYVGNLAVGAVNASTLKDFFTAALQSAKEYSPTMGPPVTCVQMSGEGKFAFVEFQTEVMAVTALQLDKVDVAGRALNVGRPAGYIPPPGGVALPTPMCLPAGLVPPGVRSLPPAYWNAAGANPPPFDGMPAPDGSGAPPSQAPMEALNGLIGGGMMPGMMPGMTGSAMASQANRKQRELYVGNLPVGMVTTSALKELFSLPLTQMPGFSEEMGPPVNNVDLSADGKFAFVEFRDEELCSVALSLFDKMELCGRALNVGRPRGYVEPPAGLPGIGLPGMLGGAAAPPAAPPAPPTACLRLEGMITEEMLGDDEYDDLLADIKEECEKHGAVAEVKIPRKGEPEVGLCFVRFEQVQASVLAKDALHNRQFDGNTVKASFIPGF